MSPIDPAGPLSGTNFQNFTLGSCEKFHPGFRNEKRPKTGCSSTTEEKSKHGETQSYNFCACHSFGNSYSWITVVKWDAYDVENTTGKTKQWRINSVEEFIRFYPGNRAEVFINFQPSYRNSGWKNGRDIGNRARKKFRGKARSRKPSSYHMKTM